MSEIQSHSVASQISDNSLVGKTGVSTKSENWRDNGKRFSIAECSPHWTVSVRLLSLICDFLFIIEEHKGCNVIGVNTTLTIREDGDEGLCEEDEKRMPARCTGAKSLYGQRPKN